METLRIACEDALDIGLVEELIEVEQASGAAVFAPFLARVANGSTLAAQTLRDALACADVATLTHKFVGIASSFGLKRVAHIAHAINVLAETGSAPTAPAIDALEAAICGDICSLRAYLKVARQQ